MNECSHPPAPDEVRLTAYLAGEDDPHTAAHLRNCPFCRKRVQTIANNDRRLRALLYRLHCPPAADLQDYVFDLLSPAQMEPIVSHLRGCPHCTHDLFQLQDFVLSMQIAPATESDTESDGGQASKPSFIRTQFDRLQFLVATLLTPPPSSGQAPALSGVRGESDERLYQADALHIGITVEPDREQPERRLLLGSLLGVDEIGWNVDLWRAGQLIASTAVDDLGSFDVEGLSIGSYALVIGNAEVKVLIPDLTVN